MSILACLTVSKMETLIQKPPILKTFLQKKIQNVSKFLKIEKYTYWKQFLVSIQNRFHNCS